MYIDESKKKESKICVRINKLRVRKKDKQTDVLEIILQQILRKKRKPSARALESERERKDIRNNNSTHSNVVVYADSNALELDKCSLDEIGFDNDQ